jgi:DNA polymerase-3 subunit delta'
MWQLIGQSQIISLFTHGIETGTLSHAYLFIGPPHIGKMTLALQVAQALNCESTERPCLECKSCQKINSMNHADVQVISLAQTDDATEAKSIGIGQIKELQHSANLPPFEGKQRVYIIDGAEVMSTEAANCLLKTLEEPPEGVTIFLLTTNDRLLPTTVVSRCQRIELTPLSKEDISQSLEKNGIEPQKARLLAGLSHGCPGWAISAAQDDSLLLHLNDELDRIIVVTEANCEERFTYIAPLAARFNQDRNSVYEVLDIWLDYWHDLMLVKLGCRDMITYTDRGDNLTELAEGYRIDQIYNYILKIGAAVDQLHQNANPRLTLEILMLDIPRKERGNPIDQLSSLS